MSGGVFRTQRVFTSVLGACLLPYLARFFSYVVLTHEKDAVFLMIAWKISKYKLYLQNI